MQVKFDGYGAARVQIVSYPDLAECTLTQKAIESVPWNLGRRNRCAQAEFLGTDLLANRLVKRVLNWVGIRYESQSKVLEIGTLASYFV